MSYICKALFGEQCPSFMGPCRNEDRRFLRSPAERVGRPISPDPCLHRALVAYYEKMLYIFDMAGHHLILGELTDLLTGEILDDTLDERYRQKIAHHLVEKAAYRPHEIEPRRKLMLQAGERRATIKIDFVVRIGGKAVMLIRFGPGSIVSRERPALAVSRLVETYQVPIAVVTNGEDAEILDAASGKVIGRGLEAIPSRAEMVERSKAFPFLEVHPDRALMESRVAYCYEVDGACPCDDTICRIE
jgi:hypothetical protein